MNHEMPPVNESDEFDDVFNIFLLDYFQKSNCDETAQTFFMETMKEYYDPPIDSHTPFFHTWWETFWNGASFGKQTREANLPKTEPFSQLAKKVNPKTDSQLKIPTPLFNNFLQVPNYFSLEREKAISSSFNPMCVVPPNASLFPDPPRFPYSSLLQNDAMPVGLFMGQTTSQQQQTARNPSAFNSDSFLNLFETQLVAKKEENLYHDQGHQNDLKAEPNGAPDLPGLARPIVKNGKKCFERIRQSRKSSSRAHDSVSNGKLFNLDFGGNDSGSSNHKPSTKPSAGKSRASQFRGVSRNGNQWQSIIMVHNKKRYIGSYSYEADAARAYDKAALQFHGEKAKTNFTYSVEEIDSIRKEDPILAAV